MLAGFDRGARQFGVLRGGRGDRDSSDRRIAPQCIERGHWGVLLPRQARCRRLNDIADGCQRVQLGKVADKILAPITAIDNRDPLRRVRWFRQSGILPKLGHSGSYRVTGAQRLFGAVGSRRLRRARTPPKSRASSVQRADLAAGRAAARLPAIPQSASVGRGYLSASAGRAAPERRAPGLPNCHQRSAPRRSDSPLAARQPRKQFQARHPPRSAPRLRRAHRRHRAQRGASRSRRRPSTTPRSQTARAEKIK